MTARLLEKNEVRLLSTNQPLELGDARLRSSEFVRRARGGGDGVRGGRWSRSRAPARLRPSLAVQPAAPKAL
jgi:hypothetical protein